MKIISGGAIGSDNVFMTCALNKEIDGEIHSFIGHNMSNNTCKKQPIIVMHSLEELDEAIPFLKKANEVLKRKIPQAGYIRNLLCRNYYQIKGTQVVVAVGKLDYKANIVSGGTGWAVQMALDMDIPVFLFDMVTNEWYASVGRNKAFVLWNKPNIHEYTRVTGIGSRDISIRGVREIKSLF